MRAVNYFKNISTFRLLLLCLLAAMGGVYVHERLAYPGVTVKDQDAYRRVHDSLQDSAATAGRYLREQESLAIGLALRFERQRDIPPEIYGRILRTALNTAPEHILTVGASTFVPRSDAHTVAYVSRDDKDQNDVTITEEELDDDDFSQPATTMPGYGRSMEWALQVDAPGINESRFSIILTASVFEGGIPGGEAMVRAGLDWLPDVLNRLEEQGGGRRSSFRRIRTYYGWIRTGFLPNRTISATKRLRGGKASAR